MVRAKSTVTAEKSTPVPATPVKKAAAPKTKKEAAPAPTPAPIPVTPVVEAEAVGETADKNSVSMSLQKEIEEFNKNFAVWQSTASAMKQNIRNISKLSARVSKNAEKSTKRKKNTQTGRLSGFEKPTLISDELAVFFSKDKGSRMARTEVSKLIHQYVQQHNLQNKENRRIIHPDAKLKKLLDSKDDELTYFNLQRYLKPHFKKEPVVA